MLRNHWITQKILFNSVQSTGKLIFGIAGDVSSGKSSLINLLLGDDILPTALLHTTSVICSIHDSNERKIICCYQEGSIDAPRTIEVSSNDELKDKLEELIAFKDRPPYKCVEVFLPMPFLKVRRLIKYY